MSKSFPQKAQALSLLGMVGTLFTVLFLLGLVERVVRLMESITVLPTPAVLANSLRRLCASVDIASLLQGKGGLTQ